MQETTTMDSMKIHSFVKALERKIKSEEEYMNDKYNFNFDEDIPINTNARSFLWQSE